MRNRKDKVGNVRVSTVLGTFEALSMTNYIISRHRKFLETKMGRKIKGFLANEATALRSGLHCLLCVMCDGGELDQRRSLSKGVGWEGAGTSTCTYLRWG